MNPDRGQTQEPSARIPLRHFSGYPTEDAERFLSDFEAYCKISRISDTEGRKVAAFQHHLSGQAQTWYSCLDADEKADWDNLVAAFEIKYCAENNTPVLLVETEQFTNLNLLPQQYIEDYYSHILEKGRKLGKSDQELLLKFIQGLPSQLAFFVRAGNPNDINAALTSAKMGEAYGYRASPLPAHNTVTVAAAAPNSSDSRISALEKSVQTLCSKLDSLINVQCGESKVCATDNTVIQGRKRSCFSCKAQGHIKRVCNWGQVKPADPNALCNICSQFGHTSTDCKQNQGNLRNPRVSGGVPLGGQ